MKRTIWTFVTCLTLFGLVAVGPARAQEFSAVAPSASTVTTNFGDAIATSVQVQGGIQTTLTDAASGRQVATLKWDFPANTMTWDVAGAGTTMERIDDSPPSLGGSNYALYYIYKNTLFALSLPATADDGQSPGAGVTDNPGCDWFPDPLETPCVRKCCDIHDACYAAQTPPCTWKSWIPFVGSRACKDCNAAVVKCIAKCVKKAVIGKLPQPIDQR